MREEVCTASRPYDVNNEEHRSVFRWLHRDAKEVDGTEVESCGVVMATMHCPNCGVRFKDQVAGY